MNRRDGGLIPTICVSVSQRPDEASIQRELFPGGHMTRHCSARDFFRQMPNAYLARYFAAREVLQDFDFKTLKETKIDALFKLRLVFIR